MHGDSSNVFMSNQEQLPACCRRLAGAGRSVGRFAFLIFFADSSSVLVLKQRMPLMSGPDT